MAKSRDGEAPEGVEPERFQRARLRTAIALSRLDSFVHFRITERIGGAMTSAVILGMIG